MRSYHSRWSLETGCGKVTQAEAPIDGRSQAAVTPRTMNIAYYMPFKPPGHANPSGDLITGRELQEFLAGQHHRIDLVSSLRSRWVYWKPRDFIRHHSEVNRVCTVLQDKPADLWLTYHSYYKAPDLLGPACTKKLGLPYVIFQGIYSTKRKRNLKTLPGFILNRRALKSAQLVCTNKRKDEKNLLRLLPREKVCYVAPGLQPDQFPFDREARQEVRENWQAGERLVILSTAMLRPGVKSDSITQVIESCADLLRSGHHLLLVVIGDGRNRQELEDLARDSLGPACLFAGRIARTELYRYYSAADLFAFPGIEESLGMVYLEAQCTGLPVVAFSDWGASEAVIDGRTGLLTPATRPSEFTAAIRRLLIEPELRATMGESAREHIRRTHDLSQNYALLTSRLEREVHTFRGPP